MLGPILHNVAWAVAYLPTMWHLDPSVIWPQQIRAKNWGLCPFGGGGAASPSKAMWPGPMPTCISSFTLIHPTVWPQYTNVTDRTGQTGRTDRTDNGLIA